MTFTAHEPDLDHNSFPAADDSLPADDATTLAMLLGNRGTVEILERELDARRHDGRAHVRREILKMRPRDGERLRGSMPRETGLFWGITGADGVTIALRARDFSTAAAARRDAIAVLRRASRFRLVRVHDGVMQRRSFWLTDAGRVVLVFAQATGYRNDQIERTARRLRRLMELPEE